MLQKDWENAEHMKSEMEQIQRDDHKLREDAKKRRDKAAKK